MNPADQAAVEAAKFNSEMAKRDAGFLMNSAADNARIFTNKAEQQLASGMTILGKTGNLDTETSKLSSSGIDLGARNTEESLQGRKTLEGQTGVPLLSGTEKWQNGDATVKSIQDDEKARKEALLGLVSGQNVPDIKSPEELLHASGSDLLTLVSTRDAMERDKRTMMRSAQNDAMAMIKSGENYTKAADYARKAGDINMWNTILGKGTKAFSMLAGAL